MTKKEILKIIEQNKDILTPENYKGILKNIDVFTDEEKDAIVYYLKTAREMLAVNDKFMKAQNAMYKGTIDELKEIDANITKKAKKEIQNASQKEEDSSSAEADKLISNL